MSLTVPSSIRVLMPNGVVTEQKLETFLAGVLYAEMGAAAPLEALKAQAIASRNYAASAHRHPEVDADVCTTMHCQEWTSVDPVIAPEVFRAVTETWGQVATYEGKLIDAFFFEHCDGHTRNAEDLLPAPVPYLKAVECGCGFVARKGHGIGMCQRGAIVMAYRGASFEEILKHYYGQVLVIQTEEVQAIVPSPQDGLPLILEPLEPTLPGIEMPATAPVVPEAEWSVPPPTAIVISPDQMRLPEPQLEFVDEPLAAEQPAPAPELQLNFVEADATPIDEQVTCIPPNPPTPEA